MPRWSVKPFVIDIAFVLLALTDCVIPFLWVGPVDGVVAVVGALGLLVRRRWPWASLVVALPAAWMGSGTIAVLIAIYSITLMSARRWPVIVAGLVAVVAMTKDWWTAIDLGELVIALIYPTLSVAAPIAIGLLVRTRTQLASQVDELEKARQAEREHEHDEVLHTERARIAREMHDVVSHQVSLIAVQAGGLQVSTPDPDAQEIGRTIRVLAVRTLDELRQMVTVLRASDATQNSIAPQPTIADLDHLIADSGIPVLASIDLPSDLPASVQRAVFRAVQEGLTNVRKHAPGATVELRAWAERSEVHLEIGNDVGDGTVLDLPSSGHGIIGLRERAEILGGSLAVASDGAHFRLSMSVPIAAAS
jgi:signal transduction histidine kinase